MEVRFGMTANPPFEVEMNYVESELPWAVTARDEQDKPYVLARFRFEEDAEAFMVASDILLTTVPSRPARSASAAARKARSASPVPDEVWVAAVPPDLQEGLICLRCFIRFADELLVQWDEDIAFWPVSRVTLEEFDDDHDEETWVLLP